MVRTLLPHLPCLSAVAAHLSFSLAAQELSLSQSAVSYQIRQLENKLGFRVLSRRQGGHVELTERGHQLLEEYRLVEKNMARVVDTLCPHSQRSLIRLTAPVDFGSKLLVPILDTIEAQGMVVDLHLSDQTIAFKESSFDLAIRSDQREANICYDHLLNCESVLVCSTGYATRYGLPKDREALAGRRILLRQRSTSRSWSSLLAGTEHSLETLSDVRILNNSFALLEAVKHDMGIALLPQYLIAKAIDSKQFCKIELVDCEAPPTPFYIAYEPSIVVRRWADIIRNALMHKPYK